MFATKIFFSGLVIHSLYQWLNDVVETYAMCLWLEKIPNQYLTTMLIEILLLNAGDIVNLARVAKLQENP